MKISPPKILALLATVLTAGIGAAQTAPAPSISSLSPSSIAAGSGAFTLIVSGANFQSGAVVSWNGTQLQPGFVSNTQLNATVPANLIAAPGFATIVVINPGNVRSNGTTFTIASTSFPLSITTSTLPAGSVGVSYAANLTAAGGSPPYTWSATSNLPPGLTLSSSGTIAGTPAVSGTYTVAVRVADSQQGIATQSFSLVIASQGLLITTSFTLPAARVGQAYTQTLTATGGTLPYTWSAGTGFPAGLSIAPSTGVITGTPAAPGTFSFTIQVTDARASIATQTFTLTVNPAPLTITTVPPLFNGTVGSPYSQTFTAAGGAPPYQWSVISGDTGDLKLDAAFGVLQGTPLTAGTLTFTVQVADSANARASQAFSLTVASPQLTIITGASLPAGTVGVSYSQQFSVVGGTQPYTWSLTAGSLPKGLTFDINKVTLSGTPSEAGPFTFTLQARDSGGVSATRAFTLTINPAPLTITTPTQLPDGALGARYSFQMSAAGGIPPYTWNATGLPDGLTIDANSGIISGTLGTAGPISLAVRVIDSTRVAFFQNTFRLNVTLPPVPSISIAGLPSTAGAAQQFSLQIALSAAFPASLSGQAILTFSPEVGGGDGTIQFSTGGTTANFTIPAGSTDATFPVSVQTGTVAGTIGISLRLNAGGLDVTPSPAPAVSGHIDQAAPVIKSATVTRGANGLSIQIVGYSTAREVTQASFTFSAAAGQTLQPAASQIAIAVDTLFGNWFQTSANNAYGSQFVFTQPFTIQGDVNAVTPQTVTLTNRRGTVTAPITLP